VNILHNNSPQLKVGNLTTIKAGSGRWVVCNVWEIVKAIPPFTSAQVLRP